MKKNLLLLALLSTPSLAAAKGGQGVAGSKHDLSIRGPGPIRAVSEGNPCVFCHVPHGALSSRPEIGNEHLPYESSTMRARPGAPTGSTRICLSCHDGTIAVGQTKTRRIEMTVGGAIPAERPSNLGTDLRRTHPVSFKPAPGSETRKPSPSSPVRLDRSGQVQCTSCHDPHAEFAGDPRRGKFLVTSAARSGLCLACHDAARFEPPGGAHALAGPSLPDKSRKFGSVSEAGCLACHEPHGADPGRQLLRRPDGDDDALCLRCHGASVARVDIAGDRAKPFAHVDPGSHAHDPAEGRAGSARRLPEISPGATRHVACVDCHDPHAASDRPGLGGASGALAGVWGIDERGHRVEQVRFEYEVCFKCHGDSANKPQDRGPAAPGSPRRAVTEANLRLAFAPSAASYHPVVAPGKNPDVPGLLPPWTPASLITCGDCHASDSSPAAGGSGARGPHGSVHRGLLERSYATAAGTLESPSAYALCYKCHDREVLLSSASGFPHALHVGEAGGVRKVNAPCSACHDPHGVSERVGTESGNAHLVDFDVGIVRPASTGGPRYRSDGPRAGSCTLTCHDASGQAKEHLELSYPVSPAPAAP